MSDDKTFELYSRMPVFAQNAACSLFGLKMRRDRYNSAYIKALDLLRESQWWALDRQRVYQEERLRFVIAHAYETVPYYRNLFQRLGLYPKDVSTLEDLKKLPVLTKDQVREHFDELQSLNWPRRRIRHGHTGGTTGKAMKLTSDRDTAPWQWAVWWRHRERFGLNLHDPFIVFAGRDVVPLNSLRPPVWRRNIFMHQTYISVHHLTRQIMPIVAEYLIRRKVRYYSGYPSALYLVASFFLRNRLRLRHPPRVVVTGAETLLPHQRRVISEAFETEVADQYGASEQCANISECEKHRYHVDFEFGIVEFLPQPGLPGQVRRIVCTGFRNPVMPLIRYDIGDLATLSETPCDCGRVSPTIEKIDGRIESYIITPDGRQLGRLDFFFKDSHRIIEAQLIQNDPSALTVRLVTAPGYGTEDEETLMSLMRRYLGDVIDIQLEYVDSIPTEANGKFRQIVSSIFRDEYAAER